MTPEQRIDEYIRAIVTNAPPLSPEQVRRLRNVFAPPPVVVESRERRAA